VALDDSTATDLRPPKKNLSVAGVADGHHSRRPLFAPVQCYRGYNKKEQRQEKQFCCWLHPHRDFAPSEERRAIAPAWLNTMT